MQISICLRRMDYDVRQYRFTSKVVMENEI